MKKHHYNITVEWTGNEGTGTSHYKTYNRNHLISNTKKYSVIEGSSDPAFRGDPSRYNPEDLFLSSLAGCHMLCYLHLCASHKIIVTKYIDHAKGIMKENSNGSGQFKEVTLFPTVTIQNKEMTDKALYLHHEANKLCFIANSCNFEIKHQATIL